jgi:preprotein translocase subunit SecA
MPLMRRLLLQVTDAFWLEHLETMDYLRRSVSLRAYGQRDPLIEYRREGLTRFTFMQDAIASAIAEALPRVEPADEARIRAEEEHTRRQILAASEAGATQAPVINARTHGRNDEVTIRKGEETQTMKYKKAEPLLSEGWELVR